MDAGDDDEVDYEIARLICSSGEPSWKLKQ